MAAIVFILVVDFCGAALLLWRISPSGGFSGFSREKTNRGKKTRGELRIPTRILSLVELESFLQVRQPFVDMGRSLRCRLPHLTASSHPARSQTPEALLLVRCRNVNENNPAPNALSNANQTHITRVHALSYRDNPSSGLRNEYRLPTGQNLKALCHV